MNIALLPQLVVSSTKGWPELERIHPSVAKVFLFLVVPMSLLPPLMLYHASTSYGAAMFGDLATRQWGLFAVVFFLAEILTFAGMGWLIKEIAGNHGANISPHDAYLLAAISPVPLWLSSLTLFVPSLALCVAVCLVALLVSSAIIYHGVFALCHMQDEIVAASIAYSVIAGGGLAWLLLALLIVLPPIVW